MAENESKATGRPWIDTDPRGPVVKIDRVAECRDGNAITAKLVSYDCGHDATMNPIYSYRVGDSGRCTRCRDHAHIVALVAERDDLRAAFEQSKMREESFKTERDRLKAALTEMVRQFEPLDVGADDGVSDCLALVLARAALEGRGA